MPAFDALKADINRTLVSARDKVRDMPAETLTDFLDSVRARAEAAALGTGTASFADLALVALAQIEIANRTDA